MTVNSQARQLERPYGIAPPGFRLPDATRVGAVHLQIGNLQRSIDYYRDVLGLHVLERAVESAGLGAAGGDRPLVWLHAKTGLKPAPRRGAFGLYHFAILLPDRAALGQFAEHLSRAGVRVGMADHLVSEALYLTDPDGLGIEVYADRPRNTWRHHDRELSMTTEPLDIENVIAAGRGHVWNGVPIGTTIGHMHLHVGNLEEADAFYHRASGSTRRYGATPARCFSPPAVITTILVRIRGRLDLRRQMIRRACSSGSSSFRAKRMPLLRRAAFVPPAMRPRTEVLAGSRQIPGERGSASSS